MLLELRLQLERRLAQPLPGNAAHALMAHEERRKFFREQVIPEDAKISSVLFLLYVQDDAVHFPLIIRSSDGTVHSGQVGLPGGRYEEQDKALSTTAMRETEEEIGVNQNKVTVLKKLTEVYIPPSNFFVQPFLGYTNKTPNFILQEDEVEDLIEVPLRHFMDDSIKSFQNFSTSYAKNIEVPVFNLNNHRVWGATAMMLSEVREMLKQLL